MTEENDIRMNESVVVQSKSNQFMRAPTPPVFSSFSQYRVMTPKEVKTEAFATNSSIMKSAKEMESNMQSVTLPAGPAFLSDTRTTIPTDHMQVFLRTSSPTMTYMPRTPYILRPYHQPLPSIGQTKVLEEDEISIVEESEDADAPPPSYESVTTKTSKWMDQSTQDSLQEEEVSKNSTNDKERQSASVAKRGLKDQKVHCSFTAEGRPESAKSAKLDPHGTTEGDSDEEEELPETNSAEIVKLMGNEDIDVRLKATIKARKKLSASDTPDLTELMEAGVVQPAVDSLMLNNADLQYEALWVLTNIASGKSEDTKAVVDKGAVPLIVGLLKSTDTRIREQAIWTLGNIAGDSYEYRKMILEEGAMTPLVDLLQETSTLSFLRNAAWALCNITRHKPMDYTADLDLILKSIKTLLDNSCNVIQSDALWALSYAMDGPTESIQAVIDHGLCPRIVELMKSDTYKVSKAALRACGSIATGSDSQTDAVLAENALELVKPMLIDGVTGVRKEICWFLSNVTAGTRSQIQKVIDAELIGPLVDTVSKGPFEVSKEAIWALSNMTSGGDPSQIKALTQAGGIKALLSVLDSNVEGNILQVALEGLSNILTMCDGHDEYELVKETILEHEGLNLLETHLHSQIESVSRMVNDILDNHFQDIPDNASSVASCDDDHDELKEEEENEEEKVVEEQDKSPKVEEVPASAVDSAPKKPVKLTSHALKYTKS
ncbi:importin subunit alpha-7-like [Palaemon carinicauda]|uniref:importin subunit alpha-7-like n=1 Tax=Palaemon carinicauda TaxID=392227 RepID=UPI0035B64C5E